jgi:hypothetical protein
LAYKRLTDAIPSGGLNLLDPGDQLPGSDGIATLNWRPDQAGVLRSRLASQIIATYPAGYIHTLFFADEHRFAGIDGDLYRDVVDIDTGYDGFPLGMVSFQDFVWVMNQARQVRIDDTGAITPYLTASPPTAAPTLALANDGLLVIGQGYTYYVTFQSDDGQETNPFSGTAPTIIPVAGTPDQRTVIITRPVSTDPLVTFWNVYRIGDTLQDAYRVNFTPIAIATTTFTDDGVQNDAALTGEDVPLQQDNDPPPPAKGLVGPYYSRLLAFNSIAHSNTLWWSKIDQPYAWPGADNDDGNHAPVGAEYEPINGVTLHPRQARIYKTKSVWRLAGDPGGDFSTLEQTNADVGLTGPICTSGVFDYFQSQEGIYKNNGDSIVKISGKLDRLFRGDFITLPGSYPMSPLNQDETIRSKNTIAVKNGRLYFSYADDTGPDVINSLVLNLDTGEWRNDSRGWSVLYYEGQFGELLGALANVVHALEYPDHTIMTTLNFTTGYRNQGSTDRKKVYADIAIEHSCVRGQVADQTLDVIAYLDNGVTILAPIGTIQVGTIASGGAQRLRTVLPIGTDGQGVEAANIAIRVNGSTNYDTSIFLIELHYYFKARDGETFDSDEMHLGYPGVVKGLDTLELDIDSVGDVIYTILTDLPGPLLASAKTATITATTGRRIVEIPITGDPVEGRLVRLLLTGGSFRLYGARFRFRPYGVYRDGGNGEQYVTQQIGLGV